LYFTLEALDAGHGDSLLLHYGDEDDPQLVIIDGGPGHVWEATLEPRLQEILELLALDRPLDVNLAMVSHIDRDHITGILKMMRQVERDRNTNRDELVNVRTLWHNSFDDIVGNTEISSVGGIAAFSGNAPIAKPDGSVIDFDTQMIAGDVRMGRDLRDVATRLGLGVNSVFDSGRVEGITEIPLDADTSLTVLGPSTAQLQALQQEWDQKLPGILSASTASAQSMVAEFLDKSAANLSSLVVLVEQNGASMLLTGDARGDFIIESLENAGLLTDGDVFFTDILKIPHHGSDRNVEPIFFESIHADFYVFSGDGTVGDNPDISTLEMLTEARGDDEYTMLFTNRLDKIRRFVRRDRRNNDRNYRIDNRNSGDLSVWVDLADPVDF
jgi:beta-lactamase superfamily II metal-dependent hydrolase